MEVREISDDPEACALVWQWYQRQPGANGAEAFADRLGPDWHHYLFSFDGEPRACISLNERRLHGYELHIAAPRKSARQTRTAAKFLLDQLLQHPAARVVAWVQVRNRASRFLTSQFLRLDGGEAMHNGEPWVRYSATAAEWSERYGIRQG